MRKSSKYARQLLGLGLAAIACPLAAQEPDAGTVVTGQKYQEVVSFEDLDLRINTDRRALVTRVKQASRRVCKAMWHDNVIEVNDARGCATQTYVETRPQISRVFKMVDNGQRVALRMVVGVNKKKA